MSRAINDICTKVVLNGVGGDEVFFGCHDHFLYHLHILKQAGHPSFESELQAWHINQNRSLSLFEGFEKFIESGAARHSPAFLARSRGFDYRVLLNEDFRTEHLHEKTLFAVDDFSARGKHIQDLTRLIILDLGCGNGAMAAIANQIAPNAKYTGMDHQENLMKEAKKSFRLLISQLAILRTISNFPGIQLRHELVGY